MSTTLNNAIGSAKEVIDSAKGSAEHAASSTRSRFSDATKFFIDVASTLRGFGLDDALGYVGLARRRTLFGTAAIFGAGVVVGAGVGILVAPRSGASLRRAILRGLDELKQDASDKLEQAGQEVKQVERTVEKKVSHVADVVKSTVEGAEEGFKEALADAKSGTSTTSKTSRSHSGPESGRSLS
jgi:gas vesicle protein